MRLMLIVCVLVLVSGDVAGAVDEIFSAGYPLAFAGFVKSLFVTAGVFGRICQSINGRSSSGRLRQL